MTGTLELLNPESVQNLQPQNLNPGKYRNPATFDASKPWCLQNLEPLNPGIFSLLSLGLYFGVL